MLWEEVVPRPVERNIDQSPLVVQVQIKLQLYAVSVPQNTQDVNHSACKHGGKGQKRQ